MLTVLVLDIIVFTLCLILAIKKTSETYDQWQMSPRNVHYSAIWIAGFFAALSFHYAMYIIHDLLGASN